MKNMCTALVGLFFLFSCSDDTIMDVVSQPTHDVPQNLSENNALKRALQISKIKWTPLKDIPNNLGVYSEGKPVEGMPYSSAKELDKFVGLEVSLETFMTAVHNPKSVLYTENIRKEPYHGTNCATYYGVVCSSVVNYALGVKTNYVTASLDTLSLFSKIPQQVPEAIRLCDVLWSKGHEVMVYDIVRNPSDSAITYVSILESAGTRTRIHGYSFEDYQQRWEKVGWVIYRYKGLDKPISYEPSPFVYVDGDPVLTYKYNDIICCNRGNKAVYREGENVIINVLDSSYTSLSLYRDNILIENRRNINSDEEYKGLSYGKYSVVATDNNENKSDAICFEVVDTKVEIRKLSSDVKIYFFSKSGCPEYIKLCDRTGSPKLIKEITAEDMLLGFAELNWPKQYKELYCKVMFSTPNGMVTNAPVLISNQ